MFSTLNYSTQHGASFNAGTNSVQMPQFAGELFSGSNSAHKIQEFKNQVIALLRFHGLEKWLGQPVEELLPEKSKYNEKDMADMRKFDEDSDKIYLQAAKAYAIVRGKFKPNSEAESVIRPADDEGRLDTLWELFCGHYDNPITKSGAAKLIQSWYTVDSQMDILALFMFFTEHFTKIETVPEKINKGVLISGINSPLKKFSMKTPSATSSADQSVTSTSAAKNLTVPAWAKTLHALYHIAEIPKHKDLVNKFIFEHVITSHNQDLRDLTVESTLELLKAFLQNNQAIKKDKTVASFNAETTFYCNFHGDNSSHSTKDCVRNNKRQRQGNFNNYSRNYERFKNYRDRSQQSSRRDRSYSPGRDNRSRPRDDRRDSPYPRREIKDKEHSTPRLNNYVAIADALTTTSKSSTKDILYGKQNYDEARSPRYQSGGSDTELDIHNTVIRLDIDDSNPAVPDASDEIIADSGTNSIVINGEHAHLVSEKVPEEGTIIGATGQQLGLVTHRGSIIFMGVPVQCYVANISKSVVGLGYLSQHYGFLFGIRLDRMQICSQFSALSAIIAGRDNLFRLPMSLFEARDMRRYATIQERNNDDTPDLLLHNDGMYDTEIDPDLFGTYMLDFNLELHTKLNAYKGEDTGSDQILADSGANHIIFNAESIHLVSDAEPVTGSIIGAAGLKLGVVTHRGTTEFMGVRMNCYVANISKSVVGLGYIAKYYGFAIQIDNGRMTIYSKRSGQHVCIAANNNHLFTLSESLFRSINITAMMTSLRPDSIHSLWHHRLGHLDDRKLAHMLKMEYYKKRGLIMDENPMKVHNEQYCDCCAQTKAHKIR